MSVFAPIVGQSQAVELLQQAIARDRVAPAYLFAGPEGVGRALTAQCFLERLLNRPSVTAESALLRKRITDRNHPDLLWVAPTYLHQGKRLSIAEAEAAGVKKKTPPIIRLEQVREIAQFLSRSPLEAPRSVVVIEQAERMAEAAANGLLKTLEEPGGATLILLAPSVEALLPTLVSRCQTIPFHRLPMDAMAQVLNRVGHADILQQTEVLQLAQGSPGAAIAHWHQLQVLTPELLDWVSEPPRSPQIALKVAKQIHQTVDPEMQLWLIDYLQQRYWQAALSGSGVPLQSVELLEKARQYLLQNVQPRLVWEVTLMKMVEV